MVNPFIYSDDNLRYHAYSYYLKHKYDHKIFKVPLDAGMTCPNRDGKCGFGGCRYCSGRGSGDTIIKDPDLHRQFISGQAALRAKWPQGKAIAYFQAYTNTYADLNHLKNLFEPFIDDPAVIELAIATRADCLETDKLKYLNALCQRKPITIELGLQSIHDQTMMRMNRGHDQACFVDAVRRIKQTDLRLCVHIINGLPGEDPAMMLDTARTIADLHCDGIKIHMLYVLKNTPLANDYFNGAIKLLSQDEYVDIVIRQLELLPPEMVIERLTGDGLKDQLLAPLWTLKKTVVRNEIAKRMTKLDTFQGKYYAPR